jgi:hypothetical protein
MKQINTVPVRMTDRNLAMLDHLCAMAPDKPTRSEMVRRLIARAHTGGTKV